LPQRPQLFTSLAVSAHELPHSVPPFAQTQAPDWQLWALGHVLPQAPQFKIVVMLVHAPLQSAEPAAHAQAPFAQLAPAGQVVPHPPQFERLVLVSTHDAPHWVKELHPVEHTPMLHT
jgi:hypothetical protein